MKTNATKHKIQGSNKNFLQILIAFEHERHYSEFLEDILRSRVILCKSCQFFEVLLYMLSDGLHQCGTCRELIGAFESKC